MGAAKKHNVPADIAGASSGTGIISIINLIPESHATIKAFALYATPFFAIGVRFGWVVIGHRLDLWLTQRAFDRALTEARALRDEVYNNPSSSEKHKHDMQEQVEKLERLYMNAKFDDLKTVRAKLKDITR